MKSIELTPIKITEIFKGKLASEAILELYRYAFPDWDKIEHIKGFPRVSQNTAEFILSLLPTDGRFLWLNKGFSSDCGLSLADKMPDWIIDFSSVEIIYTPEP
jgi:hypothetical protein